MKGAEWFYAGGCWKGRVGGGSRGEGGSSHGVLASQSLLGSPWQPHLVLLALLLFNILTLFRAKLNRLYFHFTRICFFI